MQRGVLVLALGVVALSHSACIVGQTISYSETDLTLSVSGSRDLALAVVDQRPYILDGNKGGEFVGLLRGGFGNPFDVQTTSGQAFAYVVASVLAQSLSERGFRATVVQSRPSPSTSGALEQLHDTGTDRWLLLLIAAWKTDRAMRTTHGYELSLEVGDGRGVVLARSRVAGKEHLPGNLFRNAPVALASKLAELFAPAEIGAALE